MLENPINLRPMRLVELLDAAFRLYRRNFLTFVGIMALVQIPISLFSLLSTLTLTQGMQDLTTSSGMPSAEYFMGLGGAFAVGLLTFFLVNGLATAALTRTVATSFLGGQVGVFEAYRKLGSTLGNLLLTLFLAGLIYLGLLLWLIIPCVGWLSGLGMMLFWGGVILELLIPVVVMEKRGAMDALRRTWELARLRFWWLLGLVGVLYLLSLVLIGPAALASGFIGALQSNLGRVGGLDSNVMSAVIQSLMTMLINLLYYPLQLTVIVLAYFDLRVRTEGFDLAMQSTDSTEYPEPMDRIAAAPTAPRQEKLITGMEFGYFIALTLGSFLLFTLLYGMIMLLGVGLFSFFGRGLG